MATAEDIKFGIRIVGDASAFEGEVRRVTSSLGEIQSQATRMGATVGTAGDTAAAGLKRVADGAGQAASSMAQAVGGMGAAADVAARQTTGLGGSLSRIRDEGARTAVVLEGTATAGRSLSEALTGRRAVAQTVADIGSASEIARQQTAGLGVGLSRIRDEGARTAVVLERTAGVGGLLGMRLGEAQKGMASAAQAVEISAGQMMMARRIVTSNILNVGNAAVATRGDLVAMASPLPDIIYGLRMMGVAASGMALTAGAAFVGVAAAAAGGLIHVEDLDKRTRQFTTTLRTMGDVAGVSARQLQGMSQLLAERTSFSRGDAGDAAAVLAGQRAITGQALARVLDVGANFATATDQDLAPAVDSLVRALGRGADGVRELDDAFGLFSSAEREQIRSLAEHGKQADVLEMALSRLEERFSDLAQNGMTATDRALQKLGNAWSGFWDLATLQQKPEPPLKDAIQVTESRLAAAQSRLARARSQEVAPGRINIPQRAAESEIRQLEDRLANLRRTAAADSEQARRALADRSRIEADDILRALRLQQEVLAAPAPERDLVRARQQAQSLVASRRIGGTDPTTGQPIADAVGGALEDYARDQVASRARDAADAARLQADAQERLARAAGAGSEAVRRAGVENKIAAASYQTLGVGVEEYAQQLWRAYDAEGQARRAEWTRQIDQQARANQGLALAYQDGSTAAIDAAERENEIRQAMEAVGLSYAHAAAMVDRLRESRQSLEAARAIASARQEAVDAQKLTGAEIAGGTQGRARAQAVDSAVSAFTRDNRLSADDARVEEFRAERERVYAESVRTSALALNRARDATAAYRDEMARLQQQQATGLVTSTAAAEEWRRIERARLEGSRDAADGIKRALWDIRQASRDAASQWEEDVKGMNSTARSAFIDIGMHAKTMGEGVMSILNDIQARILGRIYDRTVGFGIDSLLNGILPNAHGNAFGAGAVQPFAAGGMFANQVVNEPTLFRFAAGGATRWGIMGEAGDEAILPLRRMPSGNLGVEAAVQPVQAAATPNIAITLINQTGQPARAEASAERGPSGDMRVIIRMIGEGLVNHDLRSNGPLAQGIQSVFGASRAGVR